MHEAERKHERRATEKSVAVSGSWWQTLAEIPNRANLLLADHPRLTPIGLALGAVLLFGVYLHLALINPKNSDDAVVVLQAQDVLHGNILLHGWVSSPDSFYTTFLPLYVLGGLVTSKMATLMYVMPAATYLLLVFICGAITWKKSDPQYRLVSTLLVVIIVALPAMFYPVDAGPPIETAGDHKTTILMVMITFYLLAYSNWMLLAPVPLILAAAGDPLAIWIGIPAIGLVGLMALGRGQSRLGWRLLLSAVASLVIAKMLVYVIPKLGGFEITPGDLNNRFVYLGDFPTNLWLCLESVLASFGANFFGRDAATFDTSMLLVRLVVMMFMIWVIWRRARTATLEPDTFKSLLLIAVMLNLGAFIFSTTPRDLGTARYLPTLTVFAPILVGLCWYEVGVPAKNLWVAMPIIALAFLVPFAHRMVKPLPELVERPGLAPHDPQAVLDYLEAHGLTEGYGSYWSAGIFTVLSNDKIKVRQVAAGSGDKLVPLEWESARQWYDMKNARFLIFKDESFRVNASSAMRTWDEPADRTEVDGYVIFTWPQPLYLAQGALRPHLEGR